MKKPIDSKTFYGRNHEEVNDKVCDYIEILRKEINEEYKIIADFVHRSGNMMECYAVVNFRVLIPSETIMKSIVFRKGGRLCDPDVDTQFDDFFKNKDRKLIDYQFHGDSLFVRYEETIYTEYKEKGEQ